METMQPAWKRAYEIILFEVTGIHMYTYTMIQLF